jgi:hypothetical protein
VERHQTLRAAVEWSYSLLTGTERAVFDRIGVFPASLDEAAAVAVCAGEGIDRWDLIHALASLVAKSMLGSERSRRPPATSCWKRCAISLVTVLGRSSRVCVGVTLVTTPTSPDGPVPG